MSLDAMKAVWERRDLKPHERLVLLALADHADETGCCYPSIARLSQRTGMVERGVQGVLKRLTEMGLVTVTPNAGQGGANLYRVTPRAAVTPATHAPAPHAPPAPDAPAPHAPPPHPMRQTPAPGAPKPSRNRQKKEETPDGVSAPVTEPDRVAVAFAAYNAAAGRAGWPVAQLLNDTRRRRLAIRLDECGGLDGWGAALAKAEASDFLCGRSARGDPFLADLDFLLQSKSFTRLMEGSYDNRTGPRNGNYPGNVAHFPALSGGGGRGTSLASIVARDRAAAAQR